MGNAKLFPDSLRQGSEGPAVAVLQIFLLGAHANASIVPDGRYGEQTSIGVRNLQRELGIGPTNGFFDEKTKQRVKEIFFIDFDTFPTNLFQGETFSA